MGLSGWLLRQASARPHALVVTALYGTRVRLLVEAEIVRRGWPYALSPGEASLVVVCGRPGSDLAAAVEVVWSDVPGPRALVELAPEATAAAVSSALDRAVATLADEPYQRQDALTRAAAFQPPATDGETGAPGGVPMAGRGPDRDGLTLDRLHVPLGPVLADWPSGLIVDTVMQGDVVQEATVRAVQAAGDGTAFWDGPVGPVGEGGEGGEGSEGGEGREGREGREGGEGERERRRLAARLDGLGRFLAVAGWPRAAGEARLLRDRALAGASREELVAGCGRFVRRVRRSKVLAWMVRGLGVVEAGPGIPARLEGDVLARLRRWLDEVQEFAAAPGGGSGEGRRGRVSVVALELIPRLLDGAELAEARLIVASLDPDLDRVARERCEAGDG